MKDVSRTPPALEGRRERKRRETRARIADAAITLFLRKGFTAVTVDEIAEAADVSKRTFFDYFPAKEDVVIAWQDKFTGPLTEAVAAGPQSEAPVQAVERAMLDALGKTATPESFAIHALVQGTPALAAREQHKYVLLETRLFEALHARYPQENPLGLRLLAMVVIGALRIGTEEWQSTEGLKPEDIPSFTHKVFRMLWRQLAKLR
ncbi:TetR family transcriptional regulator [Pseudothauera rhizosphaerae]|uniref:TetR family transcriptional regulator n=1 Tax=Pseudothauera rhizosphaerae TaxID=2565932 RepID=A0A4S4AC47_9RHOO|nr:TetR family transcriptional regulator [Pseudothauera rhizosphaerae]THF56539.1 TetR family transcriptional regulator [Pseudothauera rhizosphaerae]